MSCTVHYIHTQRPTQPIRRGTEPRRPVDWKVFCWFTLPSGEKHTYSTIARNQTAETLEPWMGTLVDSLLNDLGNQVTSAGWTCTSHGASNAKRKKRR